MFSERTIDLVSRLQAAGSALIMANNFAGDGCFRQKSGASHGHIRRNSIGAWLYAGPVLAITYLRLWVAVKFVSISVLVWLVLRGRYLLRRKVSKRAAKRAFRFSGTIAFALVSLYSLALATAQKGPGGALSSGSFLAESPLGLFVWLERVHVLHFST
jgi:hypothetical protein